MRKLMLLSALALAACGEPTFDGSTDEAAQRSVERLSKGLSPEEQELLGDAVMAASVGEGSLLDLAFGPGHVESKMMSNLASLDGKTASEIIEEHEAAVADRKRREADAKLLREALERAAELADRKHFAEAAAIYASAAELPGGSEAGRAGLESVNLKMAAEEEQAAYLPLIKVTEFEAARIDTFLDKGRPAYRVAIKNTGDRTVKGVKASIIFEDSDGAPIYEEPHWVVSDEAFDGRNRLLKPGYIYDMERGEYFMVDANLASWREGAATIEIVEVEFAD